MPSIAWLCEICDGFREAGLRVRAPRWREVPEHLRGKRVRACRACIARFSPSRSTYARGQLDRHRRERR